MTLHRRLAALLTRPMSCKTKICKRMLFKMKSLLKNKKTMRKIPTNPRQRSFLRPTLGKIVLTVLFLVVVILGFQCWMADASLPLHCFVSVIIGVPFYIIIYSLFSVAGDGVGFFLGWILSIFFYYFLAACVVALWHKCRERWKK